MKKRSKKETILTVLVFFLLFLMIIILCSFPVLTRRLLQQAYQAQIQSIYLMTGLIFSQEDSERNSFNMTRENVLTALKKEDPEMIRVGEEVLAPYGYKSDNSWERVSSYYDIYKQNLMRFLAGLLVLIGINGFILYRIRAKYIKRNVIAEEILEAYFAGNYAPKVEVDYLEKAEDLLLRFGNKVQLDHKRAYEEKEGIKSLITDISHQIKTPIASLKTSFEIYCEAEDEQEREEFKVRSIQQIKQLEKLTEALLQLSRLETAMITLVPEKISVQELLIGAVNIVYAKAEDKKITIVNHTEPELLYGMTIYADPKWTVEAVANVLDNAVKYSPENTVIEMNVQELSYFVRIEIHDEGIGIPANEHAQIFSRFYRGRHKLIKESEGSGVGLYLTRMILERQGGGIWVQSAGSSGSSGTTFFIQLPL